MVAGWQDNHGGNSILRKFLGGCCGWPVSPHAVLDETRPIPFGQTVSCRLMIRRLKIPRWGAMWPPRSLLSMTNVLLGRNTLNVMMCRLGCALGGRNTHSDVATRDNKPCVGVQEGGCDGAWRNRVTAQRRMGGSTDPTRGSWQGASRAAWMPRNEANEGDESNSGVTAGPSPRWAHTCRAGNAVASGSRRCVDQNMVIRG
jgi:hypothetical protein